MLRPYQVYVYNCNDFKNLSEALEARVDVPDTEVGHYQLYCYETKDQQLAFMDGVQAVNSLPGLQHFEAVPLEHYLLQIYRGVDYDESYTEAREDGAVYDTGIIIPIEDLQNKELLLAYSRICNRTETCINDGQSNIQMLLVNPFLPAEFYRLEDFI